MSSPSTTSRSSALPDAFDGRYHAHTGWTHRAAAHRAAAVVCVSETTARDVRARWGVPEERIRRAAEFSWARSARDHIRAYWQVIDADTVPA